MPLHEGVRMEARGTEEGAGWKLGDKCESKRGKRCAVTSAALGSQSVLKPTTRGGLHCCASRQLMKVTEAL